MKQFDETTAEAARERQAVLAKPAGSLGRLEELAIFMAGWQGRVRPRIQRAQALIFAGNHGVIAQGVNAFPVEVTEIMVRTFENGGAAINQLCGVAGADLQVVSLDLDRPTADFTKGMALEVPDLVASIQTGKDAVDHGGVCDAEGLVGVRAEEELDVAAAALGAARQHLVGRAAEVVGVAHRLADEVVDPQEFR